MIPKQMNQPEIDNESNIEFSFVFRILFFPHLNSNFDAKKKNNIAIDFYFECMMNIYTTISPTDSFQWKLKKENSNSHKILRKKRYFFFFK